MEFVWRHAGCNGKNRKLPRTCLVPDPVVLVFVYWRPNAPSWSAVWPPAPLPNKTPIVPRSCCGSPLAKPMPRSRATWVWPYTRYAQLLRETGWYGLKNGLSAEDNQRLGTTDEVDEIVALLLRGLRR